MDDFLLLYNRIDHLIQTQAELKKLLGELYDVCIANGIGQQSSQFNTLYDEILKHLER